MSKSLVLAEKPSVGRDIARVLGCSQKGNGYIEGPKYVITWALGHLVTLAAPEKYNQKFAEWTMENLPMIPSPFKLEVIQNTSKQFSVVKQLLNRKDVDQIIIATDAGREGELVARWILDYAHSKKPIKRLWISSVTDKAIKEGFAKLVNGSRYDALYLAAKSRAEADWILGLNGTRALTCKHNASLSMGRVQTPTLDLIAEREAAIRAFVPQTFYEISDTLEGITFKGYDQKSGQTRMYDQSVAEETLKQLKGKTGKIIKVEKKTKSEYKTGFYDLTLLQRDANKQYSFSAKETLGIMQGLYEHHKVLTYPRTDSQYITLDIIPTLKDRLRACKNSSNQEAVAKLLKQQMTSKSSFADDKKVGDHHAIIPTEEAPDYSSFSAKEQKIYNMVVKRFVEVLSPPYQYEEIHIEYELGSLIFKGNTKKVLDLGYHLVGNSAGQLTDTSNKVLSTLKVGDEVRPVRAELTTGKTKPPSYLDEGELLMLMDENALGTVATRADIIEKIVDNLYVDKVGKHLKVTRTGRQLLEIVPDPMRKAELTAKWERDLESIAKGQLNHQVFMNRLIEFTKEMIVEIKADTTTFKHDNLSTEDCPECGKKMLQISNKNGKRLVCQDRSCGYKKNISQVTNARCPNCHKKMEMIEGKTFICKCGYKEKLEAFKQRRETSSSALSKNEVQRFLKKENNKEETFNNPFAALLKDLDQD